jgi:GT2 family glycosyltransferase
MSAQPLTSIVILTCNQLEYTRRCVEGIRRTTPQAYELVFVDNASTDGTLEYLRSIDAAVVVDNDANLGFGGGCNLGIARSRGDRILLLNNDVVPTADWLGALHSALDEDGDLGLVGPRSNRVAGAQQVDEVGYDEQSLDDLDDWAGRWRQQHAGGRTRVERLIGFCLLAERRVFARVGGFDLRYGIGNFEDDDLCLRAGVAGFGCAIVDDSFVHHFGSRTFAGERIDHVATMGDNYRRFAQAWRIAPEEIDPRTGAYDARRLLSSTAWDEQRHHAPLVAASGAPDRIDPGPVRSRLVGACCDRLDPQATRTMLLEALGKVGPDDDVTVLVRIDPRDEAAPLLLDQVADQLEQTGLPDVVVVQARDEDDRPMLHRVDEVIVAGRTAWAIGELARRLDTTVRHVAADRQ